MRARKFDVNLAKAMFVECENWRKEFKVDEIIRDFVYTEKPEVFEYYPQFYHKTDKVGSFIPFAYPKLLLNLR